MPPIFIAALPFLAIALAPALFVLVAPFVTVRTRAILAGLLLLVALGFGLDIALIDHSGITTLDVPNVFFAADSGQPREWTVARESAPAWAWHACVIAWFGAFGLWLLAHRRRIAVPQRPVLLGTVLFLSYLAVRLGLEKCAAPREIVWATGSAPVLVLLLPFVGWHAGRARYSAGRWAAALLRMALLQRLPIIAFGYAATTRQLGTHLDTHVITDMRGVFGPRHFAGDAVETWLWTIAVPHATVWIAITLLLGLVLGLVPWWLGRRGASITASRSAER